MDFALNEHQQDVQRRARAFAASEVAPVASELDRKGSIPAAIIAGAAEVGLLGCEHDFVAYVAGLIEISRKSGRRSAPSSPSTTRSSAIRSRGTETARRRTTFLTTADRQARAWMLCVCRAVGRIGRGRDSDDRRSPTAIISSSTATSDSSPAAARRASPSSMR